MMRRLLAALAVLVMLGVSADAQVAPPPVSIFSGKIKPLGYCQLTVTVSTQLSSCTGGIPAGASIVDLIVEAQAIRYRDDGTAPTTTVGMPLAVGTEKIFVQPDLTALRLISQVAGGIINVSFY